MLDDRAAYEVWKSEIPRTHTAVNWPHDFGGPGRIRARRAHRGRPAIRDPEADGEEKYHLTVLGAKRERYVFHGEYNFTPVVYCLPQPPVKELEESRKRKAPSLEKEDGTQDGADEEYNPRAHGHNQFTPRDQMVKYGAPSFARTIRKRREKINDYLRKEPMQLSGREWKLRASMNEDVQSLRSGTVGGSRLQSLEQEEDDDEEDSIGQHQFGNRTKDTDEESTLFIPEDSIEPEALGAIDSDQQFQFTPLSTSKSTKDASPAQVAVPGSTFRSEKGSTELAQHEDQIRKLQQENKQLSQSLTQAHKEIESWKQRTVAAPTPATE